MKDRWEHLLGLFGLVLLGWGSWQGLFVSPPDQFMGDVQRIMYVHVPAAWISLLVFTFAFVCALGWLWRGSWIWDAMLEASIEVGVVLGCLLIALGSIWARPTWGVWWDWDPRLTTAAVLVLAFGAIIALRTFVDDPRRRATVAAVATIVGYVDVPVVYYSVRWWRSLHQAQTGTSNMDPAMWIPLSINAFAFVFLGIWFVARRTRIAIASRTAELSDLEAM